MSADSAMRTLGDGELSTARARALRSTILRCAAFPTYSRIFRGAGLSERELAALAQGIPVIAVRENRSIMRNDLARLPWARGQLRIVENYWEAAGVVAALRAGLDPDSVRRPIRAMRARTP